MYPEPVQFKQYQAAFLKLLLTKHSHKIEKLFTANLLGKLCLLYGDMHFLFSDGALPMCIPIVEKKIMSQPLSMLSHNGYIISYWSGH